MEDIMISGPASHGFDPLLHEPERPRIAATPAALPGGDAVSVTRLRNLTGLPARSLCSRLGELGQAGSPWPGGGGPGLGT